MSGAPWQTIVPALVIALAAIPVAGQRAQPAAKPERRFLALGDSYTVGEGVQPTERWAFQMAASLNESGKNVVDMQFLARTGFTTDELEDMISKAEPAMRNKKFDLVTLQVGVNDQYRGRPAADFRAPFRTLLGRAMAFAGKASNVIVISIPDWGVTPFAKGRDRAAIAKAIDAYNAIAREEATRAGAHWVDVTRISREAHDNWTTADGLHPSPAQYARWADVITPAAMTILK